MKIPLDDALTALHATVTQRDGLPATVEVGTDTRGDLRGKTFLALRGGRFDGHDHVAAAFERGAVAAIVSRADAVPAGRPAFVVTDTVAAYLHLAGAARERLRGPVVAISGSAGKTTTKGFARDLLTAAGRTAVATPENENNEIGVAKFLLSLDDGDERVAIVEMGARKYRDLDPLVAAARPTHAILTNVGDAHLEIMGSRERLAETKWGLFSQGAQAVLSIGDAVSAARATTLASPPVWAGIDDDAPPDGARGVVLRGAVVLGIDGDRYDAVPVAFAAPGDHNRRNAASAFALGVALGIPLPRLAAGAAAMQLPNGRYDVVVLPGGVRLIFDAYNASMSGTLATLEAFGDERGRRIAVIGGMAELGVESPAMHARVGAHAARVAAAVLVGGPFAEDTARGARDAGAETVVTYGTNAEAATWLRDHLRDGDVVLLKGSRAYRMEEIRALLEGAGVLP